LDQGWRGAAGTTGIAVGGMIVGLDRLEFGRCWLIVITAGFGVTVQGIAHGLASEKVPVAK
jgi:hypothetical protein